jgi:hypothetical protein
MRTFGLSSGGSNIGRSVGVILGWCLGAFLLDPLVVQFPDGQGSDIFGAVASEEPTDQVTDAEENEVTEYTDQNSMPA